MKIFKIITVFTLLISLISFNSFAKDKKYSSHMDIGYKAGSDRNLSKVEFFSPIIQSDKSLWFIDLRGWIDDNDTSENNLGLGYRKIINDKYILGLYGFYDIRETNLDNEFKQKTFGAELLTENYDLRFNYYDADEKQAFTNTQLLNSNPQIVGTQILVNNAQSFEASFSGYDIEIGAKIPQIEDLSAFLAYYKFENDKSNIVLDGYRVRAEYKVFKTNDRKHNIILEAEYSDDDFRDDITFFGFRYNYKFGKQTSLNKLEQRMTNRVIRDIDIVVPQITPTTKKILINPDGSTTNIKFVKLGATNNGDGSESSPYNSFTDFNTKFAENDVIYVLPQGDANDRDETNIQLLDGQKLVSAKIGIKVSDITGNPADISVIRQDSSADEAKVKQIFTGNNNLIQGFDVSNDAAAALGDNITGTGIVINDKTGNAIKDNIVSSNSHIGIFVQTISDQSNQIVFNTIDSNVTEDGGVVVFSAGSSGNTISSNNMNGNGISIVSDNSSSNIISMNNIDNNGNGIYIFSRDSSDNIISSNGVNTSSTGIHVESTDSSNNIISNNSIDGSVSDGILISSEKSSRNQVLSNTISNSVTSNIDSNATGTSKITIQNNVFIGTGGATNIDGNNTAPENITIDDDQINP